MYLNNAPLRKEGWHSCGSPLLPLSSFYLSHFLHILASLLRPSSSRLRLNSTQCCLCFSIKGLWWDLFQEPGNEKHSADQWRTRQKHLELWPSHRTVTMTNSIWRGKRSLRRQSAHRLPRQRWENRPRQFPGGPPDSTHLFRKACPPRGRSLNKVLRIWGHYTLERQNLPFFFSFFLWPIGKLLISFFSWGLLKG